MSDHDDMHRHVKVYYAVFAALAVLTVITVAISYVEFGVMVAVLVALAIAIVKGSLVALFFMHLSNERRWIYGTLVLTVFFFFFVLFMPVLAYLGSNASEAPLYGP